MKQNSSNFTGLYKVHHTLKFELRPVGKTDENIHKSGLLEQDLKRAEDYHKVKIFLDGQHKLFLQKVLSGISDINWEPLALQITKFQKDRELKPDLEQLQALFRKKIVDKFTADDFYSVLVKESTPSKLFRALLENSSEVADEIKTFARFACYFKGFQENRKNIYSTEAQQTSAAHRAVNENFTKFFHQVNIFSVICHQYPDLLADIQMRTAALLNDKNIEEVFQISSYNQFLPQSGIDFINNIVGEINYAINQYRQQHKEVQNNALPFMPVLYKQILSDREQLFTIDAFNNDAELFQALKNFIDNSRTAEMFGEKAELFPALQHILRSVDANSNLFVDARYLEKISTKTTGHWNAFTDAMNAFAEKNIRSKREQEKYCNRQVFHFSDIKKWNISQTDENGNHKVIDFTTFWHGEYPSQLFETEKVLYPQLVQVISQSQASPVRDNETSTRIIKEYLDNAQEIYHMLKSLIVDSAYGGDQDLLNIFTAFNSKLEQIIPLYNQTRNYITKKATDVAKIKLMFNSPTFADGWDRNQERANLATILRKNNNFYLAIINPNGNRIDFADYVDDTQSACYQKIIYKLLPGPNKMLPKVFFSRSGIETYSPDKELLRRYRNKEHIKGENFSKPFCHELIDFFKHCISIHPDWSLFGFQFRPTESYTGIDEFYKEVAEQGYSISFENLPESAVNKLINDGKIFLFQLWNKDFSPHSTGTPNKSTLYWKTLFEEQNLADVVFKLNGEAELFLRKQAIPRKITHPEGTKLLNKTVVVGIDRVNDKAIRQAIPEEIYQELYSFVNGKKTESALSAQSREFLTKYPRLNWQTGMSIAAAEKRLIVKTAQFDIIKNRRFTENKYSFHVPITVNFKSPDKPAKFNEKVLTYLKDNPDVNIIGLDRGERNLVYLVLMNQRGEILEQRSLNFLNGVDYHSKLDLRSKERDAARKSWNSIGQIKDLKSGYLSGVIYEIAKMMVENNAIIVMEDLNIGFKRGRMKIEKQIYQNFEKALIDKLNYLVFKDQKDHKAPGGVLAGYQLAGKFESFKKLGQQCGFIFYVPAGFTSKIDPATGFVNIFNLKDCTSAVSIQDFFKNFESIVYDAEKDIFAFKFDYRKFKTHQSDYTNIWTACSLKEAYQQERDKVSGKYSAIRRNPTEDIKSAITARGESLTSGFDLLNLLRQTKADNSAAEFFKTIFYAFKLSITLRHSTAKQDNIISPVANEYGEFFDSAKIHDNTAPQNADANGAYHIALKGLYLLKYGISDGKLGKITSENWIKFAQTRHK